MMSTEEYNEWHHTKRVKQKTVVTYDEVLN